jgi:hypothetical protein
MLQSTFHVKRFVPSLSSLARAASGTLLLGSGYRVLRIYIVHETDSCLFVFLLHVLKTSTNEDSIIEDAEDFFLTTVHNS